MRLRFNFILAGLAVLTLTAALASCAPGDDEPVDERASQLDILDTEDLGEILVDGEGHVLYMFAPDVAGVVTCTFSCATNWPPLNVVDKEPPTAGEGVDESLIGKMVNPSGGDVVTYGGWPLYRYAADNEPGEHRGQDTTLNGGAWYVLRPDGTPLTDKK